MKILIATATYNRPLITKIVFEQLSKYKDNSMIYNIDDSSTTYNENNLIKWGVDLNEKTNRINIHQIRCKQLINFCELSDFKDFTHIYFTDNDAFHDPNYIDRLKNLYKRYKLPISLYNTRWHFNSTIKHEDDIIFRRSLPGISQLYDREMANNIFKNINIPTINYAWDYIFINALNTETVTSNISYIEHFGIGGIHNQSLTDFDRDRAHNPTIFLQEKRQPIINYLTNKVIEYQN